MRGLQLKNRNANLIIMLNKTCTYILDIVIDEKRGLQLPPPKSAYFKQAKRLLNSGIRLKYKIIINRE